jgi:hypothetical protein
MNSNLADELRRAFYTAHAMGATREQLHSFIDEELDRKQSREQAKAADRSRSVRLYTIPIEAEVWRDSMNDDYNIVVRWHYARSGHGLTREEFVRWFGEEAVKQIPKAS